MAESLISSHQLVVSDDTAHTLIFDTAAIGAVMQQRALMWLRGDMSRETMLKRAMVSTFLRTGQSMVIEMARVIAPDAPEGAFKRVKGQDVMEWFAGVLAALTTYALPAQSPVRLATRAVAGVDGMEEEAEGDGEEKRGEAGAGGTRLVVAVELAASATHAPGAALVGRADTARTAI